VSPTARQPARAAAGPQAANRNGALSEPVLSHACPFSHRPRPQPPLPTSHSFPSRPSSQLLFRLLSAFHPQQTPLHRGCAGWALPVEVSV